jgi:hypothetical protein
VTPLDVVKVRIQTQTFHANNRFVSPLRSMDAFSATKAAPSSAIHVYSIPFQSYKTAMLRYSSSPYIYCSELFDHVEPCLSMKRATLSPEGAFKATVHFTGTLVMIIQSMKWTLMHAVSSL